MAPITSKVLVWGLASVARVVLMWVACAITWGHGDLPVCLGSYSCCNWGVGWCPWPELAQWVIGSLCVDLRGLCWADPTIHCLWDSWSLEQESWSCPHGRLNPVLRRGGSTLQNRFLKVLLFRSSYVMDYSEFGLIARDGILSSWGSINFVNILQQVLRYNNLINFILQCYLHKQQAMSTNCHLPRSASSVTYRGFKSPRQQFCWKCDLFLQN